MYILDEAVPGRLPRHEGSWGVRVTKKCKDKDGNRVEQTIMDKTGEIPMSNEMKSPQQAMTGTSETGENVKNPQNQAMVGTSRGSK